MFGSDAGAAKVHRNAVSPHPVFDSALPSAVRRIGAL